jgi:hypothetical protein
MKPFKVICFLIVLLPTAAFSMQTMLTPSVSVKTEYTDNVDRDSEDPEHDFITSISPALSLDLLGKSAGMSASYSTSKVYYSRKPQEDDYWRHQFKVNAYSQLTKHTNFTIDGSYLQSQDEADTENPFDSIETDYTRRKGNYEYRTYTANTGLDYQFGEKDSLGLGVGIGGTENEDPTLNDSFYYRPSVDFSYWVTSQWGMELSGFYKRGIFDTSDEVASVSDEDDFEDYSGYIKFIRSFNRQLDGNVKYTFTKTIRTVREDENEEKRSHDVSIGYDYALDENTSYGVSVGATLVEETGEEDETGLSASFDFSKDFQPDMSFSVLAGYSIVEKSGRDGETGLYGSLNFSKRFERGDIGINASSGYEYNYFGAEDLGLTYYVGGGLTGGYDLTRRLSANAYADYRYSKYLDQTPERKDHRYLAGCNLSYQLLKWLYANAGYTFSTTESSDDENDYMENRVYVSLTATKGFLIWR